jgi:hypothetical protein
MKIFCEVWQNEVEAVLRLRSEICEIVVGDVAWIINLLK